MEGYICCKLLFVFANIWHNAVFFSHILSTVFGIYHLFLPCYLQSARCVDSAEEYLHLQPIASCPVLKLVVEWVCTRTPVLKELQPMAQCCLSFTISYKWFYGFRGTPYLKNHKKSLVNYCSFSASYIFSRYIYFIYLF